jgi:hypothetical protein
MAITTFVNTSCEFIACASHHQIEAQKLLARFDLPIRAGDALHLAISLHAQASLVSCDKQLVAVAKAIGAKVRNPLSPPPLQTVIDAKQNHPPSSIVRIQELADRDPIDAWPMNTNIAYEATCTRSHASTSTPR